MIPDKSKFVTNQRDMAEQFNNFFTSIGKKIQEIIPPTKKNYAQYLKNPKSNFSIKPIKPEQICDTIKSLEIVKVQVSLPFLQRFLR